MLILYRDNYRPWMLLTARIQVQVCFRRNGMSKMRCVPSAPSPCLSTDLYLLAGTILNLILEQSVL